MDQQLHREQHRDDVLPFFEAFIERYNSLPPITRTWLTLSLITTGCETMEIFSSEKLIFLWHRIKSPHSELWRILTSFSWAGPGGLADFSVLLLLYSMAVTVPLYEEDPHDAAQIHVITQQGDNGNITEQHRPRLVRRRRRHRQSDCIFAFFCCSILILITYFAISETSMLLLLLSSLSIDVPTPVLLPVFTRTLLYSLITLQSLRHPEQQHNINFFPIQGRYVPVFHVGFGIFMGYRINETIHGVIVGLIYAYLVRENEWLTSLAGRKRILSTPAWLIQMVGEEEGFVLESDGNLAGVCLEQGANPLHHAAAIGDIDYIQYMINAVESGLATSSSRNTDAYNITALFRQADRNGWEPIHEAARAGNIDVLRLLLEVDNVSGQSSESRIWRRRAGKLRVDVNRRTNGGRGFTPLRLVEDNHGSGCNCAELLREIGAVSLGFGDSE